MTWRHLPERPSKEQDTQWPRLVGSRAPAKMWIVAWPATIQNMPPNWCGPKFSCWLCAMKVRQLSADRNHSFSWIWLGRPDQLRLASQPPNRLRLCKARKVFISETLGLLRLRAGKPPILQKPTRKEESALIGGRLSPKGRLDGYKGGVWGLKSATISPSLVYTQHKNLSSSLPCIL